MNTKHNILALKLPDDELKNVLDVGYRILTHSVVELACSSVRDPNNLDQDKFGAILASTLEKQLKTNPFITTWMHLEKKLKQKTPTGTKKAGLGLVDFYYILFALKLVYVRDGLLTDKFFGFSKNADIELSRNLTCANILYRELRKNGFVAARAIDFNEDAEDVPAGDIPAVSNSYIDVIIGKLDIFFKELIKNDKNLAPFRDTVEWDHKKEPLNSFFNRTRL